MLIKKAADIPAREITEQKVYLNRRTFLRAGVLAVSTVATGAVYRSVTRAAAPSAAPQARIEGVKVADKSLEAQGFWTGEAKTPREKIIGYNNFYEFSTDKYDVAELAQKFDTRGWTIEVSGLCSKPKTFDLDQAPHAKARERRAVFCEIRRTIV